MSQLLGRLASTFLGGALAATLLNNYAPHITNWIWIPVVMASALAARIIGTYLYPYPEGEHDSHIS